MSNKTDLQKNNEILGVTPTGLIGGVSRIESALEKKNVPVEKVGTYATFSELETAINDKVTDTYDADATENDIMKDKTAYVKGKKIIGEYNPPDLTDATATANDIVSGKTAYVGSGKVTGTLVDRLQWKCDNMKSLAYEFQNYDGESLNEVLTGLDTSKVISMSYMFLSCKKLININLTNINMNNVTSASSLFGFCSALMNIYGLNISKVKDGYQMFNNCSKLQTIDSLDISEMTESTWMFSGCSTLKNISILNSNKLLNTGNMFSSCIALENLIIDTSSVQIFSYMLSSCHALTTVTLNLLNGTVLSGIISNCRNLTNLTLKNIKVSLQIGDGTSWGHLLTNNSLINTIQELWDLTGQTAQTLTMSTTSKENIANIYVKLITPTQEQIEADPYINNKKPCVVCESTDEGAMLITDYAGLKNWTIA